MQSTHSKIRIRKRNSYVAELKDDILGRSYEKS